MVNLNDLYARRVPFFGSYGKYLVGNGEVKMGGENGDIDFLSGPEISAPRYVDSIRFSFSVEGSENYYAAEIYRVQGEAMFCGRCRLDDIELYSLDFASGKDVWRAFQIKNPLKKSLKIKIYVFPCADEGSSSQSVADGVDILKDTQGWCFGNHEIKNWCLRGVRIFTEGGKVLQGENCYIIEKVLPAAEQCDVFVRFSFFYEAFQNNGENFKIALENYRSENEAFLNDLIRGLKGIEEEKIRLHIENLAIFNFMQRGISVGGYKYANMYLRDCFGALCGYNALGMKKYMSDYYSRLNECIAKASFIPNYFSSDCKTFIGHSFHNDFAELPAYYILFTKVLIGEDKNELEKVKKNLDYAFLVQKNFFETHGYIDFNGDETEQYCTDGEGQEYGSAAVYDYFHWPYASFHTMSLALASFQAYADMFSLWNDERFVQCFNRLKNTIDQMFYDAGRGEYHWAYDVEKKCFPDRQVPVYLLTPVWTGADIIHLEGCAVNAAKYLNSKGFLPDVENLCEGFCGHALPLLLYGLVKEKNMQAADRVYATILNSGYLDRYGCVSEFYSPSCKSNGHGYRHYEGGILIQALMYYRSYKKGKNNV